jgi:hypothetical protein
MSDAIPTAAEMALAGNELEIWCVLAKGSEDKSPEGFLVTTRERYPALVAYISRIDQPGILSARLIASGKASPETESDLRGRTDAARSFVGNLLIPMDGIKNQFASHVAATFIDLGNGHLIFTVYTKLGFEKAYRRAVEKLNDSAKPEGDHVV